MRHHVRTALIAVSVTGLAAVAGLALACGAVVRAVAREDGW